MQKDEIGLMGMDELVNHPTDMIIQSLIVPPACIRPSVKTGRGISNEDDLTAKVGQMVQLNEFIKIAISQGVDTKNLIEQWTLLSYTCA